MMESELEAGVRLENPDFDDTKTNDRRIRRGNENHGVFNEIQTHLKQYKIRFTFVWVLILWSLFILGLVVGDGKINANSISPPSSILRFYTVTPDCRDARPYVFRVLTNQFVHFGIAHIAFNTIMLVAFGAVCESLNGALYTFSVFQTGVRTLEFCNSAVNITV